MRDTIRIGPCGFAIESDLSIHWDEMCKKFLTTGEESADDVFRLREVDALPPVHGDCIFRRPDAVVYRHGTEEYRCYRVDRDQEFFALRKEQEIWFLSSWRQWVSQGKLLLSLLGLEKLLLKEGCILLHSSFMEYQGQAVLFTGPSGIGKSTQADLWQRYRGARIINGDRSLLCRTERGWEAWGWPFSGSSPFCENAHAPVKAVIVLDQQPDNILRRPDAAEAVKALYAQVTVNRWDPEFVSAAMDHIEDLAGAVPVWHLGCRKDVTAVQCLEEALFCD